MSSPSRRSTYTSYSSSPRTSTYSSSTYSSSPRTSIYSSPSTYTSPRTSTYSSTSSPRTSTASSYASPRTSYASPRASTASSYSSPSRIHDISNVANSSPSCDGSPYTKLKQVIRKNHDLKVAARLSMQDKENAVHEVKSKATQSIDDLKQEIVLLEDRLMNKTHEVKSLQSKMSYAAADHSTAYELERDMRRNAQAQYRVMEVKVRKSNEMIRKYKDEIASLKSQLAHQTVLSRKYEQRSTRMRKKLSEISTNIPASSESQEDVARMRAELREARLNKGNSAYYDMWRGECDNARELRKELRETQRDFEQCDKELIQVQEEITALTATSRANSQRMQKRVTRITNKSSLNTFMLLMVLNTTLKKVRKLEAEQQDSERKLIAGKEGEITELKMSLSQWGDQWQTLNSNVTHRMTELMDIFNRVPLSFLSSILLFLTLVKHAPYKWPYYRGRRVIFLVNFVITVFILFINIALCFVRETQDREEATN